MTRPRQMTVLYVFLALVVVIFLYGVVGMVYEHFEGWRYPG